MNKHIKKQVPFLAIVVLMAFAYFLNFEMYQEFQSTAYQIDRQHMPLPTFLLDVLILVFIISSPIKRLTSISKGILAFLLVFFVITIFHSFFFDSLLSKTRYLSIFSPILLLLFFEDFCSRVNTQDALKYVFFIIATLAIHFFISYFEASSFNMVTMFVTNTSYYLLLFLPLALCSEKKIVKYGLSAVVVTAILLSAKRGGIVALAMASPAFFLYQNSGKNRKLGKEILTIVIIVAACIFLYTWLDEFGQGFITERFTLTEEDNGSGRSDTYEIVFGLLQNSDFFSLLFGHGWDAVRVDSYRGYSAHNDFLEILYDFGIVTFIPYIIMYIKLVRQFVKMRKNDSKYTGAFMAALSIFFVLSMVSILILSPQLLSIAISVFVYITYLDYNSKTVRLNQK